MTRAASRQMSARWPLRPVGTHANGVWVEFPDIREDTNDGKLVLTAESLTGPNLMITEIALFPAD